MIYICIPSHNEERTVGILLWKIRQVLTAFPRDYQLLVLDDASTDRTTEVLAPYARILPLTVLRHGERRGYAASLDELLREAVRRSEYPRRDVILTIQADFTEDPDDIPTLLKRIESGADIVTTRVAIAREHAPRKLRWLRALSGRLLRRLDWPEAVTDALSGMRAFRVIGVKKALDERGPARLLEWADTWAANAVLLRAVRAYVRRVDQVDVALRPDRRQRASRLDPWANARAVVRLAFRRPPLHATPTRRGATTMTAAELAAAGTAAVTPGPAPRDRRGRERAAPAGDGAGKRSRSGAAGEPAARQTRSSRTPRAERGERSERGERPARSAAGDRTERKESRAGQGKRGQRQPTERPESEQQAEQPAAPAVRSRRGRRGRGAAAAAAASGSEAAGVSQPVEAATADALPAEGLALLDAGLIASLEALTGSGAEAIPAAERKPRRRRSSRRGRGRRGVAENAGGAEAATGAEAAEGPAEAPPGAPAGNAAPPTAGSAIEASPEEPGAFQAASAQEAGPPAAPDTAEAGEAAEGARRRRRSRRGGRGRSRRRSAGAETAAAESTGVADTTVGDTGDAGSSYGEDAVTDRAPAPAPAPPPAGTVPEAPPRPEAPPSARTVPEAPPRPEAPPSARTEPELPPRPEAPPAGGAGTTLSE